MNPDLLDQVPGWLAHPGPWVYALGGAAGMVLALGLLAGLSGRVRPAEQKPTRLRFDDFLTFVAAGVATSLAVVGMWRVFGDALGMTGPWRVALCAFLEIALLASALRARRSVITSGKAGIDGYAVWGIALLSGALASTESHGTGAVVRFVAPLIAAGLWERGLHLARREARITTKVPIAWKWTQERLAIWLGLAEPEARTTTDVAKARRLAGLTRARLALAVLEAAPRSKVLAAVTLRGVRSAMAAARLRNRTLAAVEHLRLGQDPAVMEAIRSTVAAVVNLPALTDPATIGAPGTKKPGKSRMTAPYDPAAVPAQRAAVTTTRSGSMASERVGQGDFGDLAALEAAYSAPGAGEVLPDGMPAAVREQHLLAAVGQHDNTRDRVRALRALEPGISQGRMAQILTDAGCSITRAAVGQMLGRLARDEIAATQGAGVPTKDGA